MSDLICAHCETAPAVTPRELCLACSSVRRIRRLYARSRKWSPAWETHLRSLRQRARARLPLFAEGGAHHG